MARRRRVSCAGCCGAACGAGCHGCVRIRGSLARSIRVRITRGDARHAHTTHRRGCLDCNARHGHRMARCRSRVSRASALRLGTAAATGRADLYRCVRLLGCAASDWTGSDFHQGAHRSRQPQRFSSAGCPLHGWLHPAAKCGALSLRLSDDARNVHDAVGKSH